MWLSVWLIAPQPGLPAVLKDRARLAADSLDRFPVSDDTSYLLRASTTEVKDFFAAQQVLCCSLFLPE